MGEVDGGMPDLALRLNHLFATVPKPDRSGYWTNEQASTELGRQGTPMSHAYLSQLRTGKRDNPSARHLAAIAALFGVPMEYFFDADVAEKIDADLRLLVAIRDAGIQGIAMRAHGLSPASLASLEGIIDQVRRLERLPVQETDSPVGDEPHPST